MVNLGNDWDQILFGEFEKEYYLNLRTFLKDEYKSQRIHPDMNDIFNALKLTAFKDVKVVVLGQDPYHGVGQAHGLSFSVNKGIQIPPSLQNMYKELKSDLNIDTPRHGYLVDWAKSGVLLLNTVLTVREDQANSHKGKGWEQFTDRVIMELNKRMSPIVFMLWGNNAKTKEALITGNQHLILKTAHPSPLSAHNGFFGCKHFSKANEFLRESGMDEINWRIGL